MVLELYVGIGIIKEKAAILFAGEDEKTACIQRAPSRFTRLRDSLFDLSNRASASAIRQVSCRFLPKSFTCRDAAESVGSALVYDRVLGVPHDQFAIVNQADRAIASQHERPGFAPGTLASCVLVPR